MHVAIPGTGSNIETKYQLCIYGERCCIDRPYDCSDQKRGKKEEVKEDDARDEQGDVTSNVAIDLSDKQGPMTDTSWEPGGARYWQKGNVSGGSILVLMRTLIPMLHQIT